MKKEIFILNENETQTYQPISPQPQWSGSLHSSTISQGVFLQLKWLFLQQNTNLDYRNAPRLEEALNFAQWGDKIGVRST